MSRFTIRTKSDRKRYLAEVSARLDSLDVDIIGVSAGFDNHIEDWGHVLYTEDYQEMGRMVHSTCKSSGSAVSACWKAAIITMCWDETCSHYSRGFRGFDFSGSLAQG